MTTQNFTPLSNTEVASFCSQVAMILKSGISSIEGITIMLEETEEKEESALLSSIHSTLIQTGSFYSALEDTGAFPEYLLHMVRLGEETGRLDEVMTSLSDYYEKEANLAQAIRNAVTYPFIMIVMMILVIIVLITKVMPVFNQVFRQLGTEMTGISKGLLDIGAFLNRHSLVLLTIVVIIVGIAVFMVKTKPGQRMLQSFGSYFKGARSLSEKIAACRFANGMALTLSSGLTPEECLNLTSGLIEQEAFKTKLDKCKEAVSQGEDLCSALLSCGIFAGVYARMASIGSKTGILDDVMHKIAGQYEEDIDTRITGIIATIEPTLVIILSIIVGIILLSVMLPLMSIMAGI